MPPIEKAVFEALKNFAETVKKKMAALVDGQPEDQLRSPLEVFLKEVGQAIPRDIVAKGESKLDRLGRPDYAVVVDGLLQGYIELKETGKGADPGRFRGHDKDQWKRFQSIPNLIYCDGNDWALYRNGKREGSIVRLSGDIVSDGKKAIQQEDADALWPLLTNFITWDPIVPKKPKDLAGLLAPLCRMLRDDVTDALNDSSSPLVAIADDWRQLLFPDASDARFADAYAQTVTFALLLAKSEEATVTDIDDAVKKLYAKHTLLSKALEILTDPLAKEEIPPSLKLLQRVVEAVPAKAMKVGKKEDPWLYFYEDFLAVYDPKMRKDSGVYYTPIEVVRTQVRLIDELLREKFDKPMGFADNEVITLDPAVGTGTYLLGVIDHTLDRVEAEEGEGAVPGRASTLAKNLFGFEIMVGPFSVSELRVSRALTDRGATLAQDGLGVYLTDTLESPFAEPIQLTSILREISNQHRLALKVKEKVPVIVCLGNPPYDRSEAAAKTGGWVRYGDNNRPGEEPILKDFIEPAVVAGHGGDVKNLYNLYVYFWRWALWKVLEHTTAQGPGVVSFISASSYLEGDAFSGMREHMRRFCDEIWIIDLGGEGRGTRKEENVFAIQTPVAIGVAVRYGEEQGEQPAQTRYVRIKGTKKEKLDALDSISGFQSLKWQKCPKEWQGYFKPKGAGEFFSWPLLTDLIPWQHSGVEGKRTWPIAASEQILKKRWEMLLASKDRGAAFRETGDRQISASYKISLTDAGSSTPIAKLNQRSPHPPIQPFSYRVLDRERIFADYRLLSRPRPALWQVDSESQVYLTTLINHPLGQGPALFCCANIPDRHHFRGSYGAKEVFPLYRDKDTKIPNMQRDVLTLLTDEFKLSRKLNPEDVVAYIYGVLAHPEYTERFWDELEKRELRVPLTKDRKLFEEMKEIGQRLIWLHTYGERFTGQGRRKGAVPRGKVKCTKSVPHSPAECPDDYGYNETTKVLRVGEGEFAPVKNEVWEFQVSGLKVVESWLKNRMKTTRGKKSSPLDDIGPESWTPDFTTELIKLLTILDETVEIYPRQAELLEKILDGPLFTEDELPPVPDDLRKPPKEDDEAQQAWEM